jgi:hypothetical protein
MQNTIEQLIEIAVQLDINSDDLFLLNSLKNQLKKNLSLTHKQYKLAQSKLINYKMLFAEHNIIDIDQALSSTQYPFRIADKEKTIKLIEDNNFHKIYTKYIEIKFPFNKKEINHINQIRKLSKTTFYHKKNNCHFFAYNDHIMYEILKIFAGRNFVVDPQLLTAYEQIEFIKNNAHMYVPGIYGNTIKNLHRSTQQAIEEEIGALTSDTAIKYLDRKTRFGLEKIELADDLTEGIKRCAPTAIKIASRDSTTYISKPDEERIEDLLSALLELDRFPLLVIVAPQHTSVQALDQLMSVHSYISNSIDNKLQSVLFRLDNSNDSTAKVFNEYIKENQLNNWVDTSTKVVYINYDKLPKVILKSAWKPVAALSFSSFSNSTISVYADSICDLSILRELNFTTIDQYKKKK